MLGARQRAENTEPCKGKRSQGRRLVFIWNFANPRRELVLHGPDQPPIGVEPEPRQANQDRD